jgi:hypothetical protein
MLNRKIETKTSQERANTGIGTGRTQGIGHNNILLVNNNARGLPLNPFLISNGVGDPMETNQGQRIGDEISLRGLSIKMFLENPVDRTNTHYRIMLLKGAKGEPFTHNTIFRNQSDNKMIQRRA